LGSDLGAALRPGRVEGAQRKVFAAVLIHLLLHDGALLQPEHHPGMGPQAYAGGLTLLWSGLGFF
jgi:hypothetical protein